MGIFSKTRNGFAVLWMMVGPVAAHEFFIEPQMYSVPADAEIVASLRVGENMTGVRQPYIPPNFRRFDLVMDGQVWAVPGRAGDRPALRMKAPAEGLAVVGHVTRDYRLTYTEWSKFEDFVNHKGAAWAIDAHKERGLNTDRVVEQYARFGKSLVAVGHGRGSDTAIGLRTEIVAGANPYTDDLKDGMPVTVLMDGAPRAAAQIEVFDKDPDGAVSVSILTADASGRAIIPVSAGHSYLVDAVAVLPMQPATLNDPSWETLWASLTFAVPDER